MGDDEVLFTGNPVYVYNIPKRTQERTGYLHRAKDWDINNPGWSGKIELIAAGPKCCHLQFEDEDGDVYAQAVLDKYPNPHLQTVADSSRFFVIRIEKLSGEFELVGLGFHSRDDSRQFQESLQEYFTPKTLKPSSKRSPVKISEESEPKKAKKSSPTKKSEQKGDFSCPTCNVKFRYQFQLHLHQLVHLRANKCPYCAQSFSRRARLFKHVKAHELALRRNLIVKCSDCSCNYVTEREYKVHLPLHQTLKLACSFCEDWQYTLGDVTPKEIGLQYYDIHLQQHHSEVFQPEKIECTSLNKKGEEPVKLDCYVCGQKFEDLQNLTEHVQKHGITRGIPSFVQACLHCDATFSSNSELLQHTVRKHELVSATPLTVPCSVCSSEFMNKRLLNQHLWQAHTTLACSICDDWSSTGTDEPESRRNTKAEFVKHIEDIHHDRPTTKVEATTDVADVEMEVESKTPNGTALNGKDEKDTSDVKMDQQELGEDVLPTGFEYLTGRDGAFLCYKCPASFGTSHRMRTHWIKQHGFKSACVCIDCGLPLPNNKRWIDHRLKVHGLPCRVEECTENNFHNEATLRAHEEGVHKIDVKKECTLCKSKFPFLGDLIQHVKKSHAEVKKPIVIQCQVCYQKFLHSANYRAHVIRHHQNLGCPMCSSWSFTGPSSLGNKILADHIVATHKLKPKEQIQNTEELMDEGSGEEDGDDDEEKEETMQDSTDGGERNSSAKDTTTTTTV